MRRSIFPGFFLAAGLTFLAWVAGCRTPGHPGFSRAAEVIYHHADLRTPKGLVKGGAIAVEDGKILALGPEKEILARFKGERTRVVDLKGGVAFPGMMDSLGNLLQLGTSLRQVDLLDTRSWEEVVERVASRAKRTPKGQWILGMGWDQNLWKVPAMPTHEELSKAVPDNPVWLLRVDALCGIANQKAMEICGINRNTKDPKGGRIVRGRNGEPTGVLLRTALDLVLSRIPPPSPAEIKASYLLAQDACFHAGLTGVFVPGLEWEEIDYLRQLVDSGEWHLPVSASVRSDGDPDVMDGHEPVFDYGGLLDIRCVTLYMDGALGSRGAALLEPYEDDPLNMGILSYSKEEVAEVARKAFQKGFQVSAHCIGDRAARVTLDAYEEVFGGKPHPELRWRIEHSQIVTSRDRLRYKKLGIIPSMQPTHCPSDMGWALKRIGERRKDEAYNWRAFADLGLKIAGGSDFPVESYDPLKGIYAAVTTKKEDGTPPGGYLPSVRLTRKEAVELFTINSAYAVFSEKTRGTLEPGKRAHITVYDRDIMTVPERQILESQVLFTIVDGKVVYANTEIR